MRKRTEAAAKVLSRHRVLQVSQVGNNVYCCCGEVWSPMHVAEMFDKSGVSRKELPAILRLQLRLVQ